MIFECPTCGDGSLGYADDGNGRHTVPKCEHGCVLSADDMRELQAVAELELVRPVTQRLIDTVMFDLPMQALSPAVLVDFCIANNDDYLRLYRYIRSSRLSPLALDKALGDRANIAELVK
jgi:hypothetical protein